MNKRENEPEDRDGHGWPTGRAARLSPDCLSAVAAQQTADVFVGLHEHGRSRTGKPNAAAGLMPPADRLLARYHQLRDYVGLTDDDVARAGEAWPSVENFVDDLVDDFYAEILRHGETSTVITGGGAQVERLKKTLGRWITELFHGTFDKAFVENRWNVGWRHVQLGLPQVWTAAAMSRMRDQMLGRLADRWTGNVGEYESTASAISRLMDLDLALIQDAYYAESVAIRMQTERDFAETIIGTTQSIVLLVDINGTILRGNTFVAKLVAGSANLPPEIATIDDIVPAEDIGVVKGLLIEASVDRPTGPAVARLKDSDGSQRTIRWFARTFEYRDSSTVQFPEPSRLLVGHDITDLSQAQRKAVQQERLAAIGQTMTGLAHESRNAFQRSQASLETLALEVSEKPEAVELIERIQRAHDHLLHLYEEVLQFAKPIRLDLERSNPVELVRRTWQHIVMAGDRENELLKLHTSDDVIHVLCDPFAIEQVLRNLIENALVVSPDGKPIDVTIEPTWQGDLKAVKIEIRDHGPGIPTEHLERIFEPFFSTRSRGTGLGLPISRRLAEAHGGTVEMLSGADGTRANLTLPEQATGEPVDDPLNHIDYRRSEY